MTGPIDSRSAGLAAIQQIQRQQAFTATSRVAGQTTSSPKTAGDIEDFAALTLESIMQELHAPQAPEPEAVAIQEAPQPSLRQLSETPPRRSAASSSPELNLPIDDIRAVAERAGYVGLSERDIRRAYIMGESLLADYRV